MNERIYELLTRHLQGELTGADRSELGHWMDQSEENRSIAEEFLNDDQLKEALKNVVSKKVVWQRVQEGIDERIIPMKRTWIRWVAAASIILVLGVGGYLLFFNKTKVEGPQVTVAKNNDVPAPTGSKAMITLADGTKVYLDSVGSGTLAQQDNVKLVKLANGQIAYQNASGEISTELKYNTLNNPRGSKVIDMQLSDGSHVWLNAGSSVTYPVAFIGNERKVEITGEAYFEVKHDASKPFVVSKDNVSVQVLGTHFNVNAYDDEDALKVTLLEGSVKVNAANKNVIIKPGEQAQLNVGNAIGLVVNRGVDVDEVMAWKNGKFVFNNANLQEIMRQAARWYNVDVVYESAISSERYKGEVSRASNLSDFMKILALNGVKYKIEGTTITVL